MDINETLKQFGLDNREIKVYLALIQLGRAPVLDIAKKAGIKRPTTYLVLDDLIKKGLATKTLEKSKKIFIAESPEKLAEISQQRRRAITEIIPGLLTMYNVKTDKPQLILYEGAEGIHQAYEIIAKEAKDVWWFADIDYILTNFPEIPVLFLKMMRDKDLKQREINFKTNKAIAFARKKSSKNFVFRFTTLPVDIDFALFNDKLVIFSLKDNLYAVIIEDHKIVKSFKSLYTLAWKSSVRLEAIKK